MGKSQRGMVLITSLLLLVVVTLLAVGLFRSFGIDEKIAGNMREKQRALQAAETAEEYAEHYLASGQATAPITCTAPLVAPLGQVCTTASGLANAALLPWPNAISYTPTNMNVTQSGGTGTGGLGTYYQAPEFFITYLGVTGSGLGKIYQIDAAGFGGSANTAAVVETTYQVTSTVKDLGGT